MSFDNSYTAVTGATYQASDYNTGTKGNFNAVWVGTTAGDMDYYTSATAKSRLAIGAAGGILTSSGSAPQWTAIGAAGGVLTSSGSAPQWTAIGAANTFLRSSGSAPLWRSLIYARQGGSGSVWSTPGTTAYTPSGSIIQIGVQNITVSSGGTASVAITYPTAYSDRPLIFLSENMSGSLSYTWSTGWTDDTTTGFNLHLKFANTSQTGTFTVAWMAIGI